MIGLLPQGQMDGIWHQSDQSLSVISTTYSSFWSSYLTLLSLGFLIYKMEKISNFL